MMAMFRFYQQLHWWIFSLDSSSSGCLLGSHKLRIVDESVFVTVVSVEDRVDHVDQLVIFKDLGLRNRLARLVVVVRLVVPMDERLDQFTAVQLIVVIRVMHLEIMELQFLF